MSDKATKMEIEQFDWSRKTVLLVEDVDANHIFIASALKRTGVEIILAKDGRSAIDMVRENPGIDLVLMDITST
jgi:CheY-like chemotaxis protein